jgi:arginase
MEKAKALSIVGVNEKDGQKETGVDLTPQLFREGGLIRCIEELGWTVTDHGDLKKEQFLDEIKVEQQKECEYKYDSVVNCASLGVLNGKLSDLTHKCSQKGDFVLTLGGDHGIATGSISGMLRTYPNLKVIWIDAHGDCNTPETSPSGNYHGMPAAHLFGWMGQRSIRGFDWLTVQLKTENIAYIGLRDLDHEEKVALKNANIRYYTPYDIDNLGGIRFVMDEVLDYLKPSPDSPLHVSWDVDGCDPTFIYGTGTKARCGLSERESHYILQRTFATGVFRSLDMVEVNTTMDKVKERKHFHGDNPKIKGTESLCNSLELILSAVGFTWR